MEMQFHSSCVFALLWIELHLLEIPMLKPQVLRRLDLEITLVRRWLRVDGVIRVGLWSQRISDLLRVAGDHTAAAARHKAHWSFIHKPRQEPSPEVKLCWPLDLKLWPLGRWRTHCVQPVTFCQQPKQTNKYNVWMFPIAKLFPKMYQPLPHQQGRSLSDIWASPEHPLLSCICRRSKALSPWIPDLGKICRNLLHSEGKF